MAICKFDTFALLFVLHFDMYVNKAEKNYLVAYVPQEKQEIINYKNRMIKCLQIPQKIRFKKSTKWPITENSSKCVILSWVYRLTLGCTSWKMFLAYFVLYLLCFLEVCFQNCLLCYKVNILPPYKANFTHCCVETIFLTPSFSSHPHFPHSSE